MATIVFWVPFLQACAIVLNDNELGLSDDSSIIFLDTYRGSSFYTDSVYEDSLYRNSKNSAQSEELLV